jgi:hypothetical protein
MKQSVNKKQNNMKDNQFVVDLGTLKLNDAQRASLNAAIHKAVAGELANFKSDRRIALFPVDRFPNGPIINGIIIRDFDATKFEEIIR